MYILFYLSQSVKGYFEANVILTEHLLVNAP